MRVGEPVHPRIALRPVPAAGAGPLARPRRDRAPGLWYDLGPHLVDQALQLFGPPRAMFVDLAAQRDGATTDDRFHALLRYDRLRVVLHATTLAAAETPRFVLHGTSGSWVKHGLDTQEDALKAGGVPGSPGWGHDPREGHAHDDGRQRGGAERAGRLPPVLPRLSATRSAVPAPTR